MRPIKEIRADLAKLPPEPWETESHPTNREGDSPYTEIFDADHRVIVDTSNACHPVILQGEDDGGHSYHDGGADTCDRIARMRTDAAEMLDELQRVQPAIDALRDLERARHTAIDDPNLRDMLEHLLDAVMPAVGHAWPVFSPNAATRLACDAVIRADSATREAEAEVRALRAQLAERDSLLREADRIAQSCSAAAWALEAWIDSDGEMSAAGWRAVRAKAEAFRATLAAAVLGGAK